MKWWVRPRGFVEAACMHTHDREMKQPPVVVAPDAVTAASRRARIQLREASSGPRLIWGSVEGLP